MVRFSAVIALPWALAGGVAGCDAPILPSDYSGPPVATVTGSVVPRPGASSTEVMDDTVHPKMSLEWLDRRLTEMAATLISQPVAYRRGALLESNDVEIALDSPVSAARFDVSGEIQVRLAVGKVVYYDDRNRNDLLEWRCTGPSCDAVKSVSAEYIVFVDQPPQCRAGLGTAQRAQLARGYHYFSFDGDAVMETAPGRPLSLQPAAAGADALDLTPGMHDFTTRLLETWTAGSGCEAPPA